MFLLNLFNHLENVIDIVQWNLGYETNMCNLEDVVDLVRWKLGIETARWT